MKLKVKIAMFGLVFYFYAGEKELKNFRKDSKSDDEDNEAIGCCKNNYIWVRTCSDLTSIIHELHHTVRFTCEKLGVDDEETEAYMQGYLLQEICRKLNVYKISYVINKKGEK